MVRGKTSGKDRRKSVNFVEKLEFLTDNPARSRFFKKFSTSNNYFFKSDINKLTVL